jgi:glycosyltransferase involved in cell wall biosynthesis
MRILYFSRDYTTHDRRFLLKLAASRHEILFLRLEDDGIPYEKRPLPDGVQAVEWPGGWQSARTPKQWLGLMPAFQEVLARTRPDLVQAGPVQSCGFMAAASGFHPFLIVSWGSDILVDADRDDQWRRMTRTALERSDMLLCDSNVVRERCIRLVGYDESRIVQFPWGIDLETFAPGPRPFELCGAPGPPDAFLVLSTRSWEPIYGIEVLLEAFRLARADNPALRLLLLGDGSLAGRIDRNIRRHELGDAVARPGMVPHERLADCFRSVDLYVSCSQSDGASISLLEAMATGLPAVVSNIPGNREWIRHGENGWLAPVGDSSLVASQILEAAALPENRRQEIARLNRRIAEDRADWDANFPRLLEAYDQLAGGSTG